MNTTRWRRALGGAALHGLAGWAAVAAEPAGPAGPPEVSLEASLDAASVYASRGQISSDQPVAQPCIEVATRGLRFAAWGNYNLGRHATGSRDFNELNFMAAYDLPLEALEVTAGLVDYEFPNTEDPSTLELFAALAWPNPVARPYLEVCWDVDEADGVYAYAALERGVDVVRDRLTLTPGVAAGWGSKRYNEYFFGPRSNAMNDGNVYLGANLQLADGMHVGVQVLYTWLWDGEIRDGARRTYQDTCALVYGMSVRYEF